jgi:hypothetical protein
MIHARRVGFCYDETSPADFRTGSFRWSLSSARRAGREDPRKTPPFCRQPATVRRPYHQKQQLSKCENVKKTGEMRNEVTRLLEGFFLRSIATR